MWQAGLQCAVASIDAVVHLSFKDASVQQRQQLASVGVIQLTIHGAAAPVSLHVSTSAASFAIWQRVDNSPVTQKKKKNICCVSNVVQVNASHVSLTNISQPGLKV